MGHHLNHQRSYDNIRSAATASDSHRHHHRHLRRTSLSSKASTASSSHRSHASSRTNYSFNSRRNLKYDDNFDHQLDEEHVIYAEPAEIDHYSEDDDRSSAGFSQDSEFGDEDLLSEDEYDGDVDARSTYSTETYASTVPSLAAVRTNELDQYPQHYADLEDALPSVASDSSMFASIFPSLRSLEISHPATTDGNNHLSVSTPAVTAEGQPAALTLFHLKMHDLKMRETELRRYGREEGREVCRSKRELQSFSDDRIAKNSLPRDDSGYGSSDDTGEFGHEHQHHQTPRPKPNVMTLTYSNYAVVKLKRKDKSRKMQKRISPRYKFSYWGREYVWRSSSTVSLSSSKSSSVSPWSSTTSLTLYETSLPKCPLAHLTPVPLSHEEASSESSRGGWIPRSVFTFTEQGLDICHGLNSAKSCAKSAARKAANTGRQDKCNDHENHIQDDTNDAQLRSDGDIADVIMSTALLSLIDLTIIQRSRPARPHTSLTSSLMLPLASSRALLRSTTSSISSSIASMSLPSPARFMRAATNSLNAALEDKVSGLRRKTLAATLKKTKESELEKMVKSAAKVKMRGAAVLDMRSANQRRGLTSPASRHTTLNRS